MDQVWVCASCRSVNQRREGRCYRCRTPRELVEADPASLVVAGAGSAAAGGAEALVPKYRSSAQRAALAQLLLGATIVTAVVSSALGANLVNQVLEGTLRDDDVLTVGLVGLGALGIAVMALIAWSAWLSRVVANVPAVGGGWPNVTPTAAFLENLVPGLNVLRVPAIVRDVMRRLDAAGRGEPLIVAAWLGLVGGLVLPRAGRWVLAFVAETTEDLARLAVVLDQVALGLTVVGGLFLIAIIRWVETRMAMRAPAAPGTSPRVQDSPAA